jgi:hypothetical protein
MGLVGEYTDEKTGFTISDAYFRISDMIVNKDIMTITVDCWSSQEIRDLSDTPKRKDRMCQRVYLLHEQHFNDVLISHPDAESSDGVFELVPSLFIRTYNYLKGLPEYENAVNA